MIEKILFKPIEGTIESTIWHLLGLGFKVERVFTTVSLFKKLPNWVAVTVEGESSILKTLIEGYREHSEVSLATLSTCPETGYHVVTQYESSGEYRYRRHFIEMQLTFSQTESQEYFYFPKAKKYYSYMFEQKIHKMEKYNG